MNVNTLIIHSERTLGGEKYAVFYFLCVHYHQYWDTYLGIMSELCSMVMSVPNSSTSSFSRADVL